MKVALIHDWLTGMRGGEKVLEVFCELFPDADLYTLLHIKGSVSDAIERMKIKTSFIQRLPFVRTKYQYYLPLFPLAIEQFELRGYDLILSSSHCVAKGVKKKSNALHICYCHTPMRYVWDMYDSYFSKQRSSVFTRIAMSVAVNYLRRWDVSSSERVDLYIANSKNVAARIKKIYNRDAIVIYPPVDVKNFKTSESAGDYYLIVSAFAPYKRIDLAIEAFNKLGLPLKIMGKGQDERRLKAMASSNIEFLGWKSDEELKDWYAGCKALVFPGEEDFGIVPVEAMASGRPVIAYGKGGVLETVTPLNPKSGDNQRPYNPTGVFFYEQTPESLIETVRCFEDNRERFDNKKIRGHTLKFDRTVFEKRFKDYIAGKYEELHGE